MFSHVVHFLVFSIVSHGVSIDRAITWAKHLRMDVGYSIYLQQFSYTWPATSVADCNIAPATMSLNVCKATKLVSKLNYLYRYLGKEIHAHLSLDHFPFWLPLELSQYRQVHDVHLLSTNHKRIAYIYILSTNLFLHRILLHLLLFLVLACSISNKASLNPILCGSSCKSIWCFTLPLGKWVPCMGMGQQLLGRWMARWSIKG